MSPERDEREATTVGTPRSVRGQGSPTRWGAARAYVALGANLGDPAAQFGRAARALADLAPVVGRSRLYSGPAVGGPSGQPPYLNAVLALDARAYVGREADLLAALLEVEHDLGRVRRERWGPRVIDLDLLSVGGSVVQGPTLRLPHPRLEERAFVLAPLLDLDPEWRHPLSGRRAADALAKLPATLEPNPSAW
ncbi:MAG: 2-amino-4-hydroxy-6-hydroxymethyldihydropteridine diphosphokinase [Trueperaceae bacterium]|nr:2-amino-4-hydroxy-6-hydroxymethyldihydropteridine diphosphokinase [Trueperaceae bacterium]